MSAPEATGVRRRTTVEDAEEDKNPASLSTNPNKKVQRNKPQVSPPFSKVPMNRFLLYLVLSLLLIAAFYTWRFTVWAAQAGGYWALITGYHVVAKPAVSAGVDLAASAASVAASAASTGKTGSKGKPDVQNQIYNLATALGIKPADLSNAIRPLIDPTVPNPAEVAQKELELLKLQIQNGGTVAAQQAQTEETREEPGLLGVLGEVLLD